MTSTEMMELADSFDAAADRLEKYFDQHGPGMNDTERLAIEDQIESASKQAERFGSEAADLAVKNAATSVAELSAATERAVSALGTINEVGKVIRIGTALVNLGAVILDPTPGKVVEAIRKLSDAAAPASTATNS